MGRWARLGRARIGRPCASGACTGAAGRGGEGRRPQPDAPPRTPPNPPQPQPGPHPHNTRAAPATNPAPTPAAATATPVVDVSKPLASSRELATTAGAEGGPLGASGSPHSDRSVTAATICTGLSESGRLRLGWRPAGAAPPCGATRSRLVGPTAGPGRSLTSGRSTSCRSDAAAGPPAVGRAPPCGPPSPTAAVRK